MNGIRVGWAYLYGLRLPAGLPTALPASGLRGGVLVPAGWNHGTR